MEEKDEVTMTTTTTLRSIHPLVRDLYKRVIHVGKDYPLPMYKIREIWKSAIRNPKNCPSCYNNGPRNGVSMVVPRSTQCEREIRLAVGKGRHMVREMIGIIQLKKYRTLKRNYDYNYGDNFHFNDKNTNNRKNDTKNVQHSSSISPEDRIITSAEDAMEYFNEIKDKDTTTKTSK